MSDGRCPVEVAARVHGDRLALRHGPVRATYRELDAMIAARAELARRGGVIPGQRLVSTSTDRLELILDFYALFRLGAVFLPLNTRLTTEERRRLVLAVPPPPAPPGIRAALFTSGTTGTPRLVELSDENFHASAVASSHNLGGDADQRWLLTLPLFHVGALAMVYRCAVYGACLELLEGPSFDAAGVARHLDDGITHLSLVSTTLRRLVEVRGDRPFRGVRAILVGGGPVPEDLLRRSRALGLPVLQTYGLTEACSQVTTERPGEADGATAGPPLPGITVTIVDGAGREVPAGTVGSIQVQGPTVAPALQPSLFTGDLGSLDGRGRLTVLSRRVDLIISGGENVYPVEVEAVLAAHPCVDEVAVVPKADEEWGQVPVGFVVLRGAVSDDELTAWARERLARFKVPRAWVRVGELPRNAMGKLERHRLVAALAGQ